MTSNPEYEVYALRYGENLTQPAAHNFLDGDIHGVKMPLDYFVWLIRGETSALVVDTGFDAAMATKRQRTFLTCPGDLLGKLDVSTRAIRDVIVTHLHFDHCGNYDLFPAARFHLQDQEMAYATGRCMCHATLRRPVEVEDVVAMVRKVFEDRVVFHDGAREILPGISVHRVGGHTAGLQVVRVWTRRGWLVLASDASHLYANMEQRRPFPLVHNLEAMLEGYRTCFELASAPANVIPGHDPLVMKRYPPPRPELAGLIAQLHADPI